MSRIPAALLLAYDGAAFRGWQRQPGMPTVQEAIERALGESLGRKVQIFGAARTDAGVHARGQVCHFVKESIGTQSALDALARDLATRLPPEIELRQARLAHPSFHARSSATAKRYRYRFDAFQLGPNASPDWSLARAAMESLAPLPALPGLSSPSTDRRPAPPLTCWSLEFEESVWTLTLQAPAFRKHQVRNLAGQLAAIALGLAPVESLAQLAQRTRPWMGACAPPQGLTLLEVLYPRELDPFAAAGPNAL